MRVFSKEENDEKLIKERIHEIFPFEKIKVKEKISYGFEENKIKVITVSVKKRSETNFVFNHLIGNLSDEDRKTLIRQMDSRLDQKLNFYIRLDKDRLLEGNYVITDTGNCFHFKMSVAAYPNKRETAKEMLLDCLK